MLREHIKLTDIGRMVHAMATTGSDALRGTRRFIFEKIGKAVWGKGGVNAKLSPFGAFIDFNSEDDPWKPTCEAYYKAMKEALTVMRKDADAENGGFTTSQLDELPALRMLVTTSAPEFRSFVGKKANSAGEDKALKALSVELPVRWAYQLEHVAPFYASLAFKSLRAAAAKHLSAIGAFESIGREGRRVSVWKYWDAELGKVYETQASPLPVSVDVLDLDLDTFLESATMRATFSAEISTIIKTVRSSKVAHFGPTAAKKQVVLDREVHTSFEDLIKVSAASGCTMLCTHCGSRAFRHSGRTRTGSWPAQAGQRLRTSSRLDGGTISTRSSRLWRRRRTAPRTRRSITCRSKPRGPRGRGRRWTGTRAHWRGLVIPSRSSWARTRTRTFSRKTSSAGTGPWGR